MRLPQIPLTCFGWLGFGCLGLGCLGLYAAQEPPAPTSTPSAPAPQAEVTQQEGPATFTSRSNLVQVPVVVRDKQGHPIGNLTKDDFFLFDKGKLQYIAKFTVEKAGTPYIPAVGATQVTADTAAAMPSVSPFSEGNVPTGPPVPERFIAYLIDDVHLNIGDLALMRKATADHIDRSLDLVTRIAIVTTSGVGALDFTGDIVRIHEALNHIQPYTRMATATTDCPNLSLYMADLIINKQDQNATAAAQADAQSCAGGTTTTQDVQALVRSSAIAALSIGEDQTNKAMEAMLNISERMSAMPGSRMIVLISPGFILPGDDLRPVLNALLERAIRTNVTINTLDARGVFTIIPGGDASRRTVTTSNLTARVNYDTVASIAQQDILEELSDGTGGTFFHNDNGFEEGLEQLTKQPEYIYLLGYSPSDLKYDGMYHNLKVTLKDPASRNLQARRGYYAPKRATDPNEAAKEDIREAVFSREELQDIPLDMRLQFFKSTPSNARLTVVSRVDIKSLHFRKDQDRSKDTLVVVAGLFDRNGNFVSGTQRTVEMNLRDQTLTALGSSGISIPANFEVTPGAYTIRVVVRDAEGQMMAARNGAVQIP
jgi:VWFA-related protein